jgi:hypothetical protein
MRGVKSKRLRKQARVECFANLTKMFLQGTCIQVAIDKDGKPVTDVHYTAAWPFMAYRRVLKRLKRGGRITGTKYMGASNG